MTWAAIPKDPDIAASANMPDWAAARQSFSWEQVRAELAAPPEAGFNIGWFAADRHVAEGRGGRRAIRWRSRWGRYSDVTFAQLAEQSDRLAALLQSLGLEPGQTVAVMLPRRPELHVAALGVLKAGGVFCPLFPAMGPDPVRARLVLGEARILIVSEQQYSRKIETMRASLPLLTHVLVVGDDGRPTAQDGTADFRRSIDAVRTAPHPVAMRSEDPALLHFTSGTTGMPKGAVHAHEALLGHIASARMALDLKEGDVYWCTADPGWVTGTVYGIIAPLALGVGLVLDESDFDPDGWFTLLQDERVSVWYTTPTAIHMLMRLGRAVARQYRPLSLRFAASVGEPLNPEAVAWSRDALGVPFHDTWWQTETGCITIANTAAATIRPGSMGRPLPGFDVTLVRRRPGAVQEVTDPDQPGEIAVRTGPPSMFRGYLGHPARTAESYSGEWYLTGDLARRDADGYFWFIGRRDDVIKASGHLIGPFEVEAALMDHPAVAEAGVIGRPDKTAHEVVKAFVTLNPGFEAGEALRRELLAFARTRLGAAMAPKEIVFERHLPKTRSGKIMRRLLRARELGLPEGDLSSLDRGLLDED